MLPGLTDRLTGFENHRGGTVFGSDAQPLARVISGAGNREGDGIDGAVQGSVVATYLHGPCLARNPQLADHLLSASSATCRRWSCPRSTCYAANGSPRPAAGKRAQPPTSG